MILQDFFFCAGRYMIYDLKCGCVFIEENKIITDGFALIVN